jgi:magnesium and cobalt exporter, CNNM family
MAVQLLIALLLLGANTFFVAVEFSIARLRPTQVGELVRQRKPGARSAKHAVDHIDAYLSACQLGITMASLGLGALGERAFHRLLEPALGDATLLASVGLAAATAFLIITTLHVVVGELSPKSLAIARTAPVALMTAPPMRVFYLATKPLVDTLNAMGNLLLKPFGIPPASEAGHAPHSEDELRELLRESRREGLIERGEQELSEAALIFGDIRAREVMRPRPEIQYVRTTDPPDEVARRALETKHTRLPVCEDGLDSAVGAINVKDLLPLAIGEDIDVAELARPLAHISESTEIDDALRDMRKARQHVGLVHDEHGTVTGLITIEDIIEELVGDIGNEYDDDDDAPIRTDNGRLRIAGTAPARVVAQRLDFELQDHREATIGGYVSEELGRVPSAGETVDVHGIPFEVTDADDTRVTELTAPLDRD